MRPKQMHPLCCITLETSTIGDQSPDLKLSAVPETNSDGSDSATCFAGVLYKWTNYSKGWRSRWFILRNGIISYSKLHRLDNRAQLPSHNDVRIIGDASSGRFSRLNTSGKSPGIVHLKVRDAYICVLYMYVR